MRKGIKIALGVIALGMVVGLVGLLLALKPLVLRYVMAQARERGVELTPGKLDYGLARVRLDGFGFTLAGVRGVTGKLDRADIDLDGLSPSKIDLQGVEVDAHGPPAAIALDVARWAQRYGGSFSGTRLAARGVKLRYLAGHGAGAWLSVEGGELGASSGGASTFTATQVTVACRQLGSVDATWRRSATKIELGVGARQLPNAPLRVELGYAGERPTATLKIAKTPLSTLTRLFQLDLPVDGITAKTNVELALGNGAGPLDGSFDLELEGWVPPHPRELDEIVFGDKTSVTSKLQISADRTRVLLSGITLAAGSFKLHGAGVVTRQTDHARIQLALRGDLACATLARSAADSHLGRTIGHWLGMAAHQALGGSVAVVVKIDADTRRLSHARILRTIGIGCGLRPLKLLDPARLPRFDLQKLLGPGGLGLPAPGLSGDTGAAAPAVPHGLPALPSGFPTPPKLDLPGFGTPSADTRKNATGTHQPAPAASR